MRYYFNLIKGGEILRDKDGLELVDLDGARAEALKAICEARDENGDALQDWNGWRLEVVDDQGSVVLSIPLDSVPHD